MNTSPQRAFGIRVRQLRTELGITQEDLAERCGLFRTYLSRIETGVANPTLTMIFALAQTLGVTPPELLDFSETVVPSLRPVASKVSPKKSVRLSRGVGARSTFLSLTE